MYMENIELGMFLKLMKNRIGTIVLVGLIMALFSFYAFVFTQKRYQVKTDFLIVQKQESALDFYTSSKAIEHLNGVLNEAIYSTIFINELKNDENIDPLYFSADETTALNDWKETVKIERSSNIGIIKVRVFDNNKDEALATAKGIANVLIDKNEIFGGKTEAEIKILSGPIAQSNPNVKNIVLVVLGGFIIGVLFEMLYFYLRFLNAVFKVKEEEEYLRSLKEIE